MAVKPVFFNFRFLKIETVCRIFWPRHAWRTLPQITTDHTITVTVTQHDPEGVRSMTLWPDPVTDPMVHFQLCSRQFIQNIAKIFVWVKFNLPLVIPSSPLIFIYPIFRPPQILLRHLGSTVRSQKCWSRAKCILTHLQLSKCILH